MKAHMLAATGYVAAAAAHGLIVSPPSRVAGQAMAQTCGQAAVRAVTADAGIPLEDIESPPPTCKLDLCRGAEFEDNTNRVQTLAPGQVVNMRAEIPIPHEGPANVSVVDTASNTVIGDPLISFASYADENLAKLPANNTNFNVTMPLLAGGQCMRPGECVLQWFWFGTAADQTYESCVDFVMKSKQASSKSSAKSSSKSSAKSSAKSLA